MALNAIQPVEDYKLIVNQIPTEENIELHNSAASGNPNLVQSALKKGGKPNWLDDEGASALHKAAECGSVEIINYLVQAGAVLDEQLLACKNAPLHITARKGHLKATERLLDLNAKIDIVNAYGNTPLFNALMGGSLELVELLLKRGANPAHINHHLSTSLHFVIYGNMSTTNKIEAMKQLLNIGGDNLLHAVDDSGRTVLHLAARDNQKLISDFLISRGSNPDVPDVRGHK
eukprot:357264_1